MQERVSRCGERANMVETQRRIVVMSVVVLTISACGPRVTAASTSPRAWMSCPTYFHDSTKQEAAQDHMPSTHIWVLDRDRAELLAYDMDAKSLMSTGLTWTISTSVILGKSKTTTVRVDRQTLAFKSRLRMSTGGVLTTQARCSRIAPMPLATSEVGI